MRASGNVYVFTGPLFDADTTTVGKNKVWKPTRLFKLVYAEDSKRAWAYILPNAKTPVIPPVDYATFLKATGLHLLDGIEVQASFKNTRP